MAISVMTTYEAAHRYGFSLGYVRYLLRNGKVKGKRAKINLSSSIWLIEEKSIRGFLKRRQGIKKTK